MSLHAEEKGLGNIIQEIAQKKILLKPESVQQKKESKKQTRFVFKDEYESNSIGSKDKSAAENKSESYEYDNKSKFKFKFNDGSEQSNIVGVNGSGGMAGSMGGGQGSGGGGGRR
ncbi:hypothetical protein ACFLRS_01320 [Campylobacterota bacterium]